MILALCPPMARTRALRRLSPKINRASAGGGTPAIRLTHMRLLPIVELGIARMGAVCPMWRESIRFEEVKANHRHVRPLL